jgi:hypothetical protein
MTKYQHLITFRLSEHSRCLFVRMHLKKKSEKDKSFDWPCGQSGISLPVHLGTLVQVVCLASIYIWGLLLSITTVIEELSHHAKIKGLSTASGAVTRGQCHKNTMVNYLANFNPTFSRVKMMQYTTAILG